MLNQHSHEWAKDKQKCHDQTKGEANMTRSTLQPLLHPPWAKTRPEADERTERDAGSHQVMENKSCDAKRRV
jgi:hypothetical protein